MRKIIFILLSFVMFFSFFTILLQFQNVVLAQEDSSEINSSLFAEHLNSEIMMSENFKIIIKIILGIGDVSSLTIYELIILLSIWILLFLIIVNTLELTPFFQGWMRWIGSIAVMLLIALTGVIERVSLFITSTTQNLFFFEKWPTGEIMFIAIMFIVFIIIIFLVIALKLLRWFKEYKEITKARIKGVKAGANNAYVEEKRKTEEGLTK